FVVASFFFSSRGRHTRSYGDWSSDVCSSDLSDEQIQAHHPRNGRRRDCRRRRLQGVCTRRRLARRWADRSRGPREASRTDAQARSEERRVGKEWRSRWVTCQEKKKLMSTGSR